MEKLQNFGQAKRSKIFIGGLMRCTEEQGESLIREHFKQFGEIKDIAVKAGFAFLEFMDEESVEKALSSPPEIHTLGGRQMDVKRTQDTTGLAEDRKIFVGGVSQNLSKQDMIEYFEKFGPVMTVKLVSNQNQFSERGDGPNNTNHRGYGFVLFAHEEDALAALRNKVHTIKPEEPEVEVRPGRKRVPPTSAMWAPPGPSYSYNNNYNNYGGYNNQHQRSNYNRSYPSPSQLVQSSYENPSYYMDYYRSLYGGSYGDTTTSGSPMSTRYDENAEDRDSVYVRRPHDNSANQQRQQQMYNNNNNSNNNPYTGVGLQQQQTSSSYASYGRNPLGLGDYGQATDLLSSYTSGYAGSAFPTGNGSPSYSTYNKHSTVTTGGKRGTQRQ